MRKPSLSLENACKWTEECRVAQQLGPRRDGWDSAGLVTVPRREKGKVMSKVRGHAFRATSWRPFVSQVDTVWSFVTLLG